MTPVFFIPSAAGCPSGHVKEIPCASGCPKGLTCNPNTEQLGAENFSLNGSPFQSHTQILKLCYFHQGKEKATATPKIGETPFLAYIWEKATNTISYVPFSNFV